jgi:hypothetical protein
MNTTPTISEGSPRLPYTVMGGPRWDRIRRYPYPLTLLVLGRGDRLFQGEMLKDLQARGIGEILWVEGEQPSTDMESLAHDYPDVRFLLVKAPSTMGERVNVGIDEARAPVVLVLGSDTRLSRFPSSVLGPFEKSGSLCWVPAALAPNGDLLPSWQAPQRKKGRLSVAFRVPRKDGERVLFPFDYCGLFNRARFAQSGGYDRAIASPYWQKLDFGFRCLLWGENLLGTMGISLTYTGTPPEEDTTPDAGYKLFWLKNLAVQLRRETGVIPTVKLLDYMLHSDTGPVYAVKEFRAVRGWVRTHRFRFRRDPRNILEHWESL